MDISDISERKFLKVKVKPNSKDTSIQEFDEVNEILIVRIKSPPDKGKANSELVKFLSKEFGKRVFIKSGASSRIKIIEVA